MSGTRLHLHLPAVAAAVLMLAGCAATPLSTSSSTPVTPANLPAVLRGTGDLGLIIERATGSMQVVEHSGDTALGRVEGLGDLSHAAAVFSRDGRYAYIFGRDGGMSKVDLLTRTIAKRVIQAGNSIGGAISTDGRIVAAQNYQPGGVKLFDADTLTRWNCCRRFRPVMKPPVSLRR